MQESGLKGWHLLYAGTSASAHTMWYIFRLQALILCIGTYMCSSSS